MAGHTFYGKRKLCYTELTDFTDYQGIGNDSLYKRYDSVLSVVKRAVPPAYQHFLAVPQYEEDEDTICWHVDEWNEPPQKLSELTGNVRAKYESIKENTVDAYQKAIYKLSGEDLIIFAGVIKYISDENIYCFDDKVFVVAWGMTPDVKQHKVYGSVIHEFDFVKKFKLTFDAGEHGKFLNPLDKSMTRPEGFVLSSKDLPSLSVDEGWNFSSWMPSPLGVEVHSDLNFKATYSQVVAEPQIPPIPTPAPTPPPAYFDCHFYGGKHGKIIGSTTVRKDAGSVLNASEVPQVKADKGYKFKGWDVPAAGHLMNGDVSFTAQYGRIPWYQRFWKWLSALLLLLLALVLLFCLLRSCDGCSSHREVNGVAPIDSTTTSDGKVIDDNGYIHPVTGDDGRLPDEEGIVAPVMGEGGQEIPIIREPGVPNTIANRLFLFMENENDNVEALAEDFKKAYPEEKYSIIGYDKEVKLLVVQVPESERNHIRQTINEKIPNHKFIVFDEEIYELKGDENSASEKPGWHLAAVNAPQGWKITKGSPKVKVAVVDDGIDAGHPMFRGRIVDAYNVFTQNNRLSLGVGHGTHTAALAVGSADFRSKGASGIAPGCKLMPIQVFDNGQCPLSALIAGTMYAVHHDADVVNISIGPSFKGLNQLPVEQQNEIAKRQFKNVEKLWARVCSLAAKKNCILVFAAGNDDILSSIPPENRNASSIVVAAVDGRLYPTDFTNYGPCSDISAPGKGIMSAFPRSSFKQMDGTSMAAPIVTGTIALMKSIKKNLTVTQARNVLYKTGSDVYGFMPPMVLVDKALMGVKRGDFSAPAERRMPPVPGSETGGSGSHTEMPPVQEPSPAEPPESGSETDYDAIRRKISEYKRKINELEKLLPNKK